MIYCYCFSKNSNLPVVFSFSQDVDLRYVMASNKWIFSEDTVYLAKVLILGLVYALVLFKESKVLV